MPLYITFTSLSPEGKEAIAKDPARIKANNKELEAMGVKVLAQYATLGRLDFINIFEAPSEEAIFKVAVRLSGRGIGKTETLTAVPIDEFIAIAKK